MPQRTPMGRLLSSTALPWASLVLRPSACHLDVAPTTTATGLPPIAGDGDKKGDSRWRRLAEKKAGAVHDLADPDTIIGCHGGHGAATSVGVVSGRWL